jgi:hypothetical protein
MALEKKPASGRLRSLSTQPTMPEALAVFLVLLVAAGVYLGALIHSRNPANHHAGRELERLRGHEAWLRQRLQLAAREKWSGDMVARITDELGATSRQLAKASAQTGEN